MGLVDDLEEIMMVDGIGNGEEECFLCFMSVTTSREEEMT